METARVPANEAPEKVAPASRSIVRRFGVVRIAVCALIAISAACLLFNYFTHPSIVRLRHTVADNDYLAIDQFEAKVIDPDGTVSGTTRKPVDGAVSGRTVTLQWRCNVKNKTPASVRYFLEVELLDHDGFVLSTSTYDSNGTLGDLPPFTTHKIYMDVAVNRTRVRNLAACKINLKALKTDSEIRAEEEAARQERLRAEAERRREEERKRQDAVKEAENRRLEAENQRREEEQKKLETQQQRKEATMRESAAREVRKNAELSRWYRLQIGMSMYQVETLLGRPSSILGGAYSYTWSYPAIEGTYILRTIYFDANGKVQSWHGP